MLFSVTNILVFISLAAFVKSQCEFNIKDISSPYPIFLDNHERHQLYPDKSGNFLVPKGYQIRAVCPENSVKGFNTEVSSLICDGNKHFHIQGTSMKLEDVKCLRKKAFPTAYEVTTSTPQDNCPYETIQVGYKYNNNLHPQITVCFDKKSARTVWSHQVLSHKNTHCEDFENDLSFREGNSFKGLASVYEQKNQIPTLKKLLSEDGKTLPPYISPNFLLERGHLTPRCGFLHPTDQYSTYTYLNVAPQWKTVNRNNWKTMEIQLRNFVSSKTVDVDVYTGTCGILQLPVYQAAKDTKVYLDLKNQKVPVPEIIYKIVVTREEHKRGVAIAAFNNPGLKKLIKPICKEDICDKLTWLKIKKEIREDPAKGYMTCCEIADFQNAKLCEKELPHFDVKDLMYR